MADGFSVLTGTCQFTPRVSGTWIGKAAVFDPEVHRVTLDMTLSREMRDALSLVGVEVLAVKDSVAFIGLVTDTLTGLSGNTATIGEDIRIEGHKIRVEGEEEEIGVYFVDADGKPTKVTRRLTQNDPKMLIARIPASLTSGAYTLRIVTRHAGSNTLLKKPRTIEYSEPLTLKAAE